MNKQTEIKKVKELDQERYVTVYSEKEKKQAELNFLNNLSDVIHLVIEAVERGSIDSYLTEGGFAEFLERQAKNYDDIISLYCE